MTKKTSAAKMTTKTNESNMVQRPVLPIVEDYEGYIPSHIDLQLNHEQGILFAKVREGLRKTNAKLKSGKPVWNNPDVIRWLFENLTEYNEYKTV